MTIIFLYKKTKRILQMNYENELLMKLSRGQGLGEYVHNLILTLSILSNNHLRLNLFPDVMIVNFDVLGLFMKY